MLKVGSLLPLLLFCYHALCLFLVARKTGTGHAWLAWVPVADAWLMCWVAGFSAWWLVALVVVFFLLGLIQPVGLDTLRLITGVLIGLFWCARVAQARGKRPWLGVLMILPIIGQVVWGYLAFSDGEGTTPRQEKGAPMP